MLRLVEPDRLLSVEPWSDFSSVFVSSLLGLNLGRFFCPFSKLISSLRRVISSCWRSTVSESCSMIPIKPFTKGVCSDSGMSGRLIFIETKGSTWLEATILKV
ncbi:hypothetical protein PBPRA1489 [Photobacterium profundum SS9]|uniref:Uncharacterized protein n=1 Tax=Photobacterium profundum (strain SS9) TaxID=298386 RepID=Q6LS26_PHOPR|nr:hypothetical protein PBPRA1489 [Photobacterium profundum SS9]